MDYFEQFKDFELFNNENLGQIRTLQDEKGETYFFANDICECLGYDKVNFGHRINEHTDPDDRKALKYKASSESDKAEFFGKNDFMDKIFVNEAGLYQLIFESQMPKAKEFKSWITHEVIPAIREHGGYIYGQEKLNDIDKEIVTTKIKQLKQQVALLNKEKRELIHDRAVLKQNKKKLNEYLIRSDEDYEHALAQNTQLSNELYDLKHPEIKEELKARIKEENETYHNSEFTVDSNGFRVTAKKQQEETKTFTIPVSWEVYDTIKVDANTLEEALEWAKRYIDEIPLGTTPEYVDASYQIGDYNLAESMNQDLIENDEIDL